jgi:hypothetical protein
MVAATLPQHAEIGEIVDGMLPPEPNVTEGDLKSILREFQQQIAYHNEKAKQRAHVRLAAKRSEWEVALIMMSPLL